MVGFESQFYSASEGGVVELCAVVYTADDVQCPIPFKFSLNVTIHSTGENSEFVCLFNIQ